MTGEGAHRSDNNGAVLYRPQQDVAVMVVAAEGAEQRIRENG